MLKRSATTVILVVLLLQACGTIGIGADGSRRIVVNNQAEYQQVSATLEPGDTVVLANGTWQDFEILFAGTGTKEKPITLTAQVFGKVFITGQSNLRIAGEHLLVSGLVFKEGYTPTDSVISFRKDADNLASHSRITQVVIDYFNNPERTETDYWVSIYGKHNRFDHNHLVGKHNKGVTMAVRLNSEASQQNYHQIDHNYFGPRQILGSNGGETLRVGTSHYSLANSYTTIENNYFDRCDGELEIISNKSAGNVIRGNVFFESRGTLTLRHGRDNRVEDNIFFGNGVDHTGGIRIINADQTIRNNYMEGLVGYRFGGALVVMNGVPDSPINRYHQVENALIANNSLIHSDHVQLAAGSDAERSAVPVKSQFVNNFIYSEKQADVFTVYDDVSGIRFENNIQNNSGEFGISQGFSNIDTTLTRASNGMLYAEHESLTTVGVNKTLAPIAKDQTGVDWYSKPGKRDKFDGGTHIDVAAEVGALARAVQQAQAGDVLRLAAGEHVVSRILAINKPLTLSSAQPGRSAIISYERTALFEIQDGGSLRLQGLHITGAQTPDSAGNSVVRTQRSSMLVNYELIVEDCTVDKLDINHSFNFLNASKGTFADRIKISNSKFSDITGYILKLDAETDDYGIYNAEYVDIHHSVFDNVSGALTSFYRGGTDESTFGPHFDMSDNKLRNVGYGKRNKSKAVIYLHGVQVTNIRNNTISNSPAISVAHTVGEPVTRIADNSFIDTALPGVVELNSGLENTAIIENNNTGGAG